jgi:hypothetical protein
VPTLGGGGGGGGGDPAPAAAAATAPVEDRASEAAHGPSGLLATYFEIPLTEFPALAAREAEFELTPVVATADDASGAPMGGAAILCTRSSDAAYIARYCIAGGGGGEGKGGEVEGRAAASCACVACTLRGFSEDRIWFPQSSSTDDDGLATGKEGGEDGGGVSILPCRVYLRHCVLAARSLGPAAEASFLDHTFLSDRATTLRRHLEGNPTIMEEEPPPSLVDRYSG